MFDDLLKETSFGSFVQGSVFEPVTEKQYEYVLLICRYFGWNVPCLNTKTQACRWLEKHAPEFEMEMTGERAYFEALHDDAGDRNP